ncbi:MAG: hypothetical protein D3906_08270 [Candidatus Electrothrix sp. AUS1_2]|nr:hypothetical protein [Candidatus Electrothrix sp. AUS1_2]
MKIKRCPTCGGKIRIYYDHEPGDEVYCEDCEREFQLIGINPIMLESFDHDEEYYFEDDEY